MREAGVGAEVELDLGGRTDMPSIGEAGRPLRVSGNRPGPHRRPLDGARPDVHRGTGRHGPERGPRHRRDADRGRLPPPRAVGPRGVHSRWGSSRSTTVTSCSSPASTTGPASVVLPKLTLTLDGTGVTTSDNDVLRYRRVRRPIYPLDRIQPAVARGHRALRRTHGNLRIQDPCIAHRAPSRTPTAWNSRPSAAFAASSARAPSPTAISPPTSRKVPSCPDWLIAELGLEGKLAGQTEESRQGREAARCALPGPRLPGTGRHDPRERGGRGRHGDGSSWSS